MSLLQSCALFQGVSPEGLNALQALLQERTYCAGQLIFDEGEEADGLYVVKDGEVEVSAAVDGSGHRLVSRLGPGESFGEMAFIEEMPRSASVRASQDTTLYFLPGEQFHKVLGQNPSITRALTRQISHRLREFTRHYIKETLEAERMALVGRFTGAIMHDLKNPLNIIGLSAELLASEEMSRAEREESSLRVRRQVERIADLISEVLEFTRPDKQSFVPARVNYAMFLTQVIVEEKPVLDSRRIALNVAEPVPNVDLLLNPKRLQRVFANLLHNAAEAVNDQGEITLRFSEEASGILTEMEDNGPGIAAEVREQLFDAFVTHGKPHGTGLGLAIARRIIEDHGGWIAAENRAEGGARFKFWLPKPAGA